MINFDFKFMSALLDYWCRMLCEVYPVMVLPGRFRGMGYRTNAPPPQRGGAPSSNCGLAELAGQTSQVARLQIRLLGLKYNLFFTISICYLSG